MQYRYYASAAQVQYRYGDVQYRFSTGIQVQYRHSRGKFQVHYMYDKATEQVDYKNSTNRVSVQYLCSNNPVQVQYRYSACTGQMKHSNNIDAVKVMFRCSTGTVLANGIDPSS